MLTKGTMSVSALAHLHDLDSRNLNVIEPQVVTNDLSRPIALTDQSPCFVVLECGGVAFDVGNGCYLKGE